MKQHLRITTVLSHRAYQNVLTHKQRNQMTVFRDIKQDLPQVLWGQRIQSYLNRFESVLLQLTVVYFSSVHVLSTRQVFSLQGTNRLF